MRATRRRHLQQLLGFGTLRDFTPEQANQLLPRLRPLVHLVSAAYQEAKATREQIEEALAAGPWTDEGQRRFCDLCREYGCLVNRIAARAQEIAELGAILADPDEGLLDFPATIQGQRIHLCWHPSEDRVSYWHGPCAGFLDRKPLAGIPISTVH